MVAGFKLLALVIAIGRLRGYQANMLGDERKKCYVEAKLSLRVF